MRGKRLSKSCLPAKTIIVSSNFIRAVDGFRFISVANITIANVEADARAFSSHYVYPMYIYIEIRSPDIAYRVSRPLLVAIVLAKVAFEI